MSLRRLISVSSVVIVISGVAVAQPTGAPPEPAPPVEGSAVQPIEDEPPADMEGTDENPDAPRGTESKPATVTGPVDTKPTGYPIEESQRPITLPANMSEISIAPHVQLSPFVGSDALRARYGITPQVQLGLTYVLWGVYDRQDVDIGLSKKYELHPGKAGGLDVTVLVKNWLAVRVGLPIYLDPFAMSLALGAPMKFILNDKVAIGGMDDVLNIALPLGGEFAPSFQQELFNARAASRDSTGSTQSRGTLRFSGFGVYNHKPNLALIGRLAVELDDFATKKNARGHGGTTTSIRAGVQFSPKKFLDVGGSLGWDDLARVGSFGPAAFVAVRI